MFEVSWTDHDRELVGERRARKEHGKTDTSHGDGLLSGQTSGCTSICTGSSAASGEKSISSEKQAKFFGSLRLKKGLKFLRNKSPATLESSIPTLEGDTAISATSTASSVSTSCSSVYSNDELPTLPDPPDSRTCPELLWPPRKNPLAGYSGESSLLKVFEPPTPKRDPIVSAKEARETESPYCSRSEVVQALGPNSWVAKTTEMTFERRSDSYNGGARSEVKIAANRLNLHSPTPPSSPERHGPHPVTRNNRVDGISTVTPPAFQTSKPPATPPGRRQGKYQVVSPPKRLAIFRAHNPDAWKPPADWNTRPSSEMSRPRVDAPAQAPIQEDDMSMDLISMQRELRRMTSASPQVMLLRLKEDWGTAADPAFYKELEMEQKRWMLAALHNLDGPQNVTSVSRTPGTESEARKILALFESKATATYLAAMHPSSLITHLSTTPLSHALFPNIQPLFCPVPSSTRLSLAPDSFSAVYSLSLPSAIPGQSIPALLRSINRCLRPAGVLHLTLIDPCPAAASLGPRLRRWLEDNLLLGAQRRFRCVSPGRLLPAWLADAGLRAEGSSAVTVAFRAVVGSPRQEGGGQAHVKDELRSVAGRMLWREVWGRYVNGARWWWEEEDIVEECVRLGTYWEYSVVEGVKEA